jgi:hypothetical protein
MIAQEMLYEFELSADRVSSKAAANLPLAAKITYLNRGLINFCISQYDGDPKRDKGFEESRRRTEALQVLVVAHKELKVKALTKRIFQADISTVKDYLLLLRREVYGSKGKCISDPMRTIIECQTDDLGEYLGNPNKRPSFRWRRCLERTAQNKLEYFTDETFSISRVVIDYLRYPKMIDVAGYEHFDGTASADVNCELPVFTHSEIVAMAALEFDWDMNSPGQQSKAARLQMKS